MWGKRDEQMPIPDIALALIFVFFSYLQRWIFNNVFTQNINLEFSLRTHVQLVHVFDT